jgi:hypothetical protein
MLPMLSAVAPLAKILFNTIEKSIPDKDLQEKLKAQLNQQLLQSSTEELKAAASIVEAEAKAGWFTASWRPLLMYVLIFILIWNYILGPIVNHNRFARRCVDIITNRFGRVCSWKIWGEYRKISR